MTIEQSNFLIGLQNFGHLAALRPRRTAPPEDSSSGREDRGGTARASVWLESILARNPDSAVYLSDTVASEVFLHLGMNLDPETADAAPQILCIIGPFGSGKTTELNETLRRVGCEAVRIEASELESPHAGLPAQLIRARYIKASEALSATDKPHALVIEDIHMALGVDTATYRTINTQLVVSALMSICDQPHHVCGTTTARIPIMATANDLSTVYGALTRPGRMRVVPRSVSEADRVRIAAHILGKSVSLQQVAALVVQHADWQIASFRQLKAVLLRRGFNRRCAGKTATDVLRGLLLRREFNNPGTLCDEVISQQEIDEAVAAIAAEVSAKQDFTGARRGQDATDKA